MTLEWPTKRRKDLVKYAAHYRAQTQKGMGLETLRLELSRIVIDVKTDKDGNTHDVYLLPHEIAAVVSYCYAIYPRKHDMDIA